LLCNRKLGVALTQSYVFVLRSIVNKDLDFGTIDRNSQFFGSQSAKQIVDLYRRREFTIIKLNKNFYF
jgi:hypothetical protein